nr:hypothetical protein [Tanacetum cinerariifolium]
GSGARAASGECGQVRRRLCHAASPSACRRLPVAAATSRVSSIASPSSSAAMRPS